MAQPLLLSTWSFGRSANIAGWRVLGAGGTALDAVEQTCIAAEDDPRVDSVGFGGLPDRSGRVSLDGCVMLSPSQCGSVCFVRRFSHPVSIARRVMERTPHVMLAGEGAERFAEAEGFTPTQLLSDDAKKRYEEMMAELKGDASAAQWQRVATPANREEEKAGFGNRESGIGNKVDRQIEGGQKARNSGSSPESRNLNPESPLPHAEPSHDTIGVLALDAGGTLAGACSTSGLALKLPGRVGDSPIIGSGLYVHPRHGAAVATGTGELVMGISGSFLAVECMRRGAAPEAALRECMNRLMESYDLREHHQVGMIALSPSGQWAQLSLRPGYRTAVRHAAADELVEAPACLSAR